MRVRYFHSHCTCKSLPFATLDVTFDIFRFCDTRFRLIPGGELNQNSSNVAVL